jgi:hypothetical protein
MDPYMCDPKTNPRNGDTVVRYVEKFNTKIASRVLLVSVFWDKDKILLVDYVEKDASIIVKYSVAILDKLKQ